MYALVDCNNFYVSCERVFNPQLKNHPVVVLSNNDGCVISRSNEAKELKIPMGAPAFQFQKIFTEYRVTVFSSNYALYADMSERVMNLLHQYTPDMEIYSIDECFLKFNGYDTFYDFQTIGNQIKNQIKTGLDIPVCIGFAETKALAKVANKIAKKFPKELNGVYIIDNDEKRIKALKWLKIEDVWGIGKRLAKRLALLNVKTAYDFTQISDSFLKKEFSVVELRLKKELLGESVLALEDIKNKKSIATTRSFEKDTNNFEYIKERVISFAANCAEKLRKQNSDTNMVTVLLQTNPLKPTPQYRRTITIKLPYATNSTITIAKHTISALDQIYREGYAYKRAGVIVSGLSNSNEKQLNLFTEENSKHFQLMKTIDQINKKIGEPKLKLASQDLNRTWKMKQEHLSPNFTTKINQTIVVNLNIA